MQVLASPSRQVCRFGPFEISFEFGEVRKDGLRLKLQGQPFHVLRVLIENRGEPVSREFLRQQLWPEGTFVDFEHGLNTAIKKVRDTLGDDPTRPLYIETVPRKGYRFVAPVETVGSAVMVPENARVESNRRRITLLSIAIACVIGLASLATIAIVELRALPKVRVNATQQLTFSEDLSPYSNIETDGRRVFYFKYSDSHLYSIPVHGGTESAIQTRFDTPMILHLSPDGSILLVRERSDFTGGGSGQVWQLPTNGATARPLADVHAQAAAFSVNGKTIAYALGHQVFVTDSSGKTSEVLFEAAGNVLWLRYSPDGRRIRFGVHDLAGGRSSVWEIPSDGHGKSRPVNLGNVPNADLGFWLPSGRYFLFRVSRDLRSDYWVAHDGWLPRTHQSVLFGGGGPDAIAAVDSPLEGLVFTVQFERSARSFVFDQTRKQLLPLLHNASILEPVISQDGSWFAVVQSLNQQRILWRVSRDGSVWQQLTDSKMYVHHARISPDGRRIALLAMDGNGAWAIYWMAAEGGALHRVEENIVDAADPNWMPDNDSILYGESARSSSDPDAQRAISITSLTSNHSETITGSQGWFGPHISNDGRRFLALSIDEQKLGVFEFATREWRVLLERPNQRLRAPSWSPDDKWAYVNMVGKGFRDELVRVNVDNLRVEKVLALHDALPYPDCWSSGVSSEGQILISCVRPNADLYAMKYE